MKRMIRNFTIAVFCASTALSASAHAVSGSSEYVPNVDLDFVAPAAVIEVTNTAADKHVNNVKLGVSGDKLDIGIDGFVECKNANNVVFMTASAYFGGVGIGGFGQLNTAATLHSQEVEVAYKQKGSVAEATEDVFSVPLNKIKAGAPALRVDPLDEINKKLLAHVNGGGNKADFYKNDQQVVLQRPVSLGAVCGKLKDTDARSVGFETRNVTITIKYKGDPAVNDTPVLNAQLNQGNVPNQIGNNLPFRLDQATFQPNMPDYTGKCAPAANPKIRMSFQVSGSEAGVIDLRVVPVSNTYADYGAYFVTEGMIRDPKNGGGHLDFEFPLKDMLGQQKYSYMAVSDGKTYNHNMKIQARYKNLQGDAWGEYKDFDTAVFKHRCMPQVNVQMGGGGKVGGFQQPDPDQDQGGNKHGLKVKAVPADPAAPVRAVAPPQEAPKPALLLPAIQK